VSVKRYPFELNKRKILTKVSIKRGTFFRTPCMICAYFISFRYIGKQNSIKASQVGSSRFTIYFTKFTKFGVLRYKNFATQDQLSNGFKIILVLT